MAKLGANVTLRRENVGYDVEQATFVIDCLGGYSKSLNDNLKKIHMNKKTADNVILNIQKIIVSEATLTMNRFKGEFRFVKFFFQN